MNKEPAAARPTPPAAADPCAVQNLARVLAEEPRLEAVAFETKTKKLAIATFGDDPGQRLAGRVQDALAAPDGSRCGDTGPDGACQQCGAPVDSRTGQSGHARVVVKQVMGNTLIEKQTCTTAIHFWKWQNLRWPRFVPRAVELPGRSPDDHDHGGHGHGHAHHADEWRTLALQAGGCLLAGLAAFGSEKVGAPWQLTLALWLTTYVLGAWEAAEETREKLRAGELDVHFLMLAVALGAAAIGAWHEGALLLFLFSASGAMEHYAMGRTEREIGALLRGAPKTAVVLENGNEREVPVESLTPGQTVRVTAGQAIPVDLRVERGESACDESNLTGEARPVAKAVGDDLFSGTLNLDGLLEGRVLRPASESSLQRVVHLIEHAQKLRAPSQRFTDKFGTPYTYGILGLCTAMFFVWWLGFRLPPFVSDVHTKSAFYRAMTLLVVASPCALVLSIPSAILSAIAFGARRGVLFRGGAALEELARVDTVAMDKTGTLTAGDLQLAGVEVFQGDEPRLLAAAFNLARFSDHPLSRTLKRLGQTRGLPLVEPQNFESVPGKGLRAELAGKPHALGRRDFIAAFSPSEISHLKSEIPSASAEVWVAGPGLLGRLTFRDQLRPESRQLLADLHAHGVRTLMLTGDRRAAAEPMALELGVGEVRAELLPEQKLAAVQELKANGRHRVAMIGDGVNDAPCLAAADVGVAMGARGSDAALEQAAVILMNDRLENFLLAYRLSRRTRRVIAQNLALSLGVVAVMVLTSLLTTVPLALGVAAHEGSTVLVVLNSLRLLLGGSRGAGNA